MRKSGEEVGLIDLEDGGSNHLRAVNAGCRILPGTQNARAAAPSQDALTAGPLILIGEAAIPNEPKFSLT